MKTKKISKKLVLKKQTISNLSKDQMLALKGGEQTDYPCWTDIQLICTGTSDCKSLVPQYCPTASYYC
jgi:natural product precursor